MVKIIDKIEECPYMCEHCKHFKHGHSCLAFDVIPLDILLDAESHTTVLPDQKGDYVFEPAGPRDTMRIYVDSEEAPEA